jgi:lysophospholipase L1-like esterase
MVERDISAFDVLRICGWVKDSSVLVRYVSVAGVLCAVLSGCAAPDLSTSSPDDKNWVASWSSAQMVLEKSGALPSVPQHDATVRQIVRSSLAGRQLRVRISNVFGRDSLVVDASSVALALGAGRSDIDVKTLHALRFDGRRAVTIAPGAERSSDPVELPVGAGAELAISMHFASTPTPATGHPGARTTSFVAAGNRVLEPQLHQSEKVVRWFQLSGIEVWAPGARSVIAIGDSITDGYGATTDGYERWTDFLAMRIRHAGMFDIGIINAGIGGGRMLHDGLGPSLVSRFERDVLERPGVSHVIILVGVNDLGGLHRAGQDTPAARATMLDELKQAHRKLVGQAHAKGICVIGATLTPYGSSAYYKPGAENEKDRLALNDWIRASGVFDGVVDFDAALRDPRAPHRLARPLDNDGLHPSAAGYKAMADAVPLAALASCRLAKPVRPAP